MTNYTRGREVEYKVTHLLEGQGYLAQRAASSKGNWDVYAISPTGVLLVSCKRSKDLKSARSTYAAEKKKLLTLAGKVPNGARQGLYIWIDKAPGSLGGGWYVQEIIGPTPEEVVAELADLSGMDEVQKAEYYKGELKKIIDNFADLRDQGLDAIQALYSALPKDSDHMNVAGLKEKIVKSTLAMDALLETVIARKNLTEDYRTAQRNAKTVLEARKLLEEQEFDGIEVEPEY